MYARTSSEPLNTARRRVLVCGSASLVLNSGNKAIDGQANEQTGVQWFNDEIANITTLNWLQAT